MQSNIDTLRVILQALENRITARFVEQLRNAWSKPGRLHNTPLSLSFIGSGTTGLVHTCLISALQSATCDVNVRALSPSHLLFSFDFRATIKTVTPRVRIVIFFIFSKLIASTLLANWERARRSFDDDMMRMRAPPLTRSKRLGQNCFKRRPGIALRKKNKNIYIYKYIYIYIYENKKYATSGRAR